jgi:hypothetical protein
LPPVRVISVAGQWRIQPYVFWVYWSDLIVTVPRRLAAVIVDSSNRLSGSLSSNTAGNLVIVYKDIDAMELCSTQHQYLREWHRETPR